MHAVFVTVISAEEVKKAREGLGKVYIAGTVTAIDELKLTVKRTDGVVQVIEVDEGTSFQTGTRDGRDDERRRCYRGEHRRREWQWRRCGW